MINKYLTKENISIWLSPIANVSLTIILLILNVYLGIIGIVLSALSLYNAYELYTIKDRAFKEYADNLEVYFEGFSKKAIFSMPFSVIVLDKDNQLNWYNSRFKNMISRKDSLVEEDIDDILPGITDLFEKDNDNQVFDYEYEQRNYSVHYSLLERENVKLLYFVDQTEAVDIAMTYENEKLVILNIKLDNLDELNQNLSSEKRPILYAEIDTLITSYFHKYGSFIKKSENGRYHAVSYKESLEAMLEEKFSFVEEVRRVEAGNTLAPTLSIGVAYDDESPRLIEKSANAALDIALGRGGDQIVIKRQDDLEYIGGNSQATTKRTKVRARVLAHALSQLIGRSTEVFISGHVNPDMDSIGSSIGLWHAAREKGKDAYIVLSKVTPAIENIYRYTTENIEDLEDYIISPDEAYSKIKSSSLFIITDNHRKNSTEEPRLFEKTDSVVIIDHHRRGSDYIENAELTYLEPSSSSASELVTEMLLYMDDGIAINKIVAEALLAGISMDTKHFTQQTSSRTFEAASVLKQNGADSDTVNELFVEDFDTLKAKSQIISTAEIYKDIFIIGIFDKETDESSLIASQAANDLVQITGIEASFVLTKQNSKVHISARSNKKVSVQLIMEKLNGGGHRNMAATQLEVDMEEAKSLLKKAIKEYMEENE
ncbi:DHH family phosphoesterase [Helcococcus massiliensis]|uniref:DHH family phosphoesterase n=1 Tax=Helcococcus massiliensis TaxID=2040290 RepID=UPI000CDEBC4A|nr:DHH family phosphoesterase [Helcococcus massiliensis]